MARPQGMTEFVSDTVTGRPDQNHWRRAARALRDTSLGYGQWLCAEADSALRHDGAKAAGMPHALVVATSLPPRFDGGVFRPLFWLRYASENGWRISAVTRANDGSEPEGGHLLAAAIPPDVAICRAPPPALRPSWRAFQQVDGGFLTALSLYQAGARTFAAAPPAVVVATGPGFAAFVAGMLLARRFGARLVLDYRDEWSENPFGFVQKGRDDRRWERRCLKAADLVLFTTESQLQHGRTTFPREIGDKGAVLLNGWEPDPAVAAAEEDVSDDGRMVIASSGVLGTMATPGAFLADLALLMNTDPHMQAALRLRFIGRRLAVAERELAQFPYPGALDLIDQCPRAEADRLIRRSDVLLLLSNRDMARYLPGKLFEYLATGKPILVHGHPGEAQALVQRLGAGLYVPQGEREGLARALDIFSRTQVTTWNGRVRRNWAHGHTRQRIAHAFFQRLETVTGLDGTRGDRP